MTPRERYLLQFGLDLSLYSTAISYGDMEKRQSTVKVSPGISHEWYTDGQGGAFCRRCGLRTVKGGGHA